MHRGSITSQYIYIYFFSGHKTSIDFKTSNIPHISSMLGQCFNSLESLLQTLPQHLMQHKFKHITLQSNSGGIDQQTSVKSTVETI